jgi:hypothetical protein
LFLYLFRLLIIENKGLPSVPFRFVPPRSITCLAPPLLLLLFVGIDSLVRSGVTGRARFTDLGHLSGLAAYLCGSRGF